MNRLATTCLIVSMIAFPVSAQDVPSTILKACGSSKSKGFDRYGTFYIGGKNNRVYGGIAVKRDGARITKVLYAIPSFYDDKRKLRWSRTCILSKTNSASPTFKARMSKATLSGRTIHMADGVTTYTIRWQ